MWETLTLKDGADWVVCARVTLAHGALGIEASVGSMLTSRATWAIGLTLLKQNTNK